MTDPSAAAFWDARAVTFDDEPDHGLGDPLTRRAWTALIDELVGGTERRRREDGGDPGTVVDLGCGTGSLSVLLAARGHDVLGIDASPKMIDRAKVKAEAAGLDIEFAVGDVTTAPIAAGPLEAVVCRHLLWAVPDPSAVVARWSAPLDAHGAFVAIEGVWNGAGIAAEQMASILLEHFTDVRLTDLADQTNLWGKAVDDVRYAAIGRHRR